MQYISNPTARSPLRGRFTWILVLTFTGNPSLAFGTGGGVGQAIVIQAAPPPIQCGSDEAGRLVPFTDIVTTGTLTLLLGEPGDRTPPSGAGGNVVLSNGAANPAGTTLYSPDGVSSHDAGTGLVRTRLISGAAPIVDATRGRLAPNLFLQPDPSGAATPAQDWRGTSAAALDQNGGLGGGVANGSGLVVPPGAAALLHAPGAGTQATITAAAQAGHRYVCVGVIASLACGAAASGIRALNLIDGVSGGGAFWSIDLQAAVNGVDRVIVLPMWLPGSLSAAMTLEFSAAGPAGSFEKVILLYCHVT